MNRNNGSKKWVVGQELVGVIFVFGVLIGSIFCLFGKENRRTTFEILNGFLKLEKEGGIERGIFLKIVYHYFIQLFSIWLMGLFTLTVPLALFLLGQIAFAYSYTITTFLIGYGGRGLGISFLCFGLQGMFMMSLGITICLQALKNCGQGLKNKSNNYLWIPVSIICNAICVTCIDFLINHKGIEIICKII